MAKQLILQVLADVGNAIAGLKNVGGALDDISKKAKDVGGKMTDFGKSLGAVTTVPIVAALGAATKTALDFDTQIGDAGRALDLQGAKLDNFKKQILETAPALGQMPTKFAEIATEAGKLGIAGDKVVEFAQLVSKGVMATGADAIEMSKNLAALQTITGSSAQDMEKLVAAANKVDDAIGGSTPEILEFVRQTAAAGKLVNINTKELAAYGGAMQSLGIQNGVAYRTMGKLITTLAAPQVLSKNQIEGLNALGISATEMAAKMKESGSGGVQFFLDKVKSIATTDPQRALGAVKELIGADFGDEVLTSALAVDKFKEALKYAGDDAGNLAKFQAEVEKKTQGVAGQIQVFNANLAQVGITIGSAILPALNALLSGLLPVIQAFGKFAEANPVLVQIGVGVAGLVAAIAPLIIIIGSLITAVGSIGAAMGTIAPILAGVTAAVGGAVAAVVSVPGLITVAIAAAVAAVAYGVYQIVTHWDSIKAGTAAAWDAVVAKIGQAKDALAQKWTELTTAAGTAWTNIQNTINQAGANIQAKWTELQASAGTIWASIQARVQSAGTAISQKWVEVQNATSAAWTGIVAKVQEGVSTATKALSGLPAAFQSSMSNAYNVVRNTMAQIIKAITDAVSSMVNALKNAGASMMNTLADGIKGAASAPVNAVQGAMSAVRSYLPGSDAKLGALSDLTASGRALLQTFADAMMSNVAPVLKAASSVASAAMPSEQRAPMLMGNNSSSNITINFQPTVNLSGSANQDDGRKLLAQMEKWSSEILDLLDRNRSRNNRR
ncbi:phage tail tape measure protein [Brasilonema sp. CT11]|nr:phage tail tape measure protein [Brasilonema sp. CT11]